MVADIVDVIHAYNGNPPRNVKTEAFARQQHRFAGGIVGREDAARFRQRGNPFNEMVRLGENVIPPVWPKFPLLLSACRFRGRGESVETLSGKRDETGERLASHAIPWQIMLEWRVCEIVESRKQQLAQRHFREGFRVAVGVNGADALLGFSKVYYRKT